MSKYDKLWKYISKKNKNELIITFNEVEKLLGFEIDHSFLTHKKELLEYGYVVNKILMKNKEISIGRK